MRKNWLNQIREGLKYKYPLCCILSFILYPDRKVDTVGVMKRGGEYWIPCKFHQPMALTLREHILLLNDGDLSWIVF